MAGTRIYFICPDKTAPTGGIRMIYRQVDVLNRHGFAAFVLHNQPGFRCEWFENSTPVAYSTQAKITPDDFLVLPEVCTPKIFHGTAGVPKVIFNQNCFQSFLGWEAEGQVGQVPYLLPELRGVIVVSDHSHEYLRYAFGDLPLFRLHYSINPALYRFQQEKKPQIAYMPRKNRADAAQVVHLLRFHGALGEFQFKAIEDVSESAAAATLRESLVFLSFSQAEGFGLPPAEAMACGCLTVGYHGTGGREYFRPEFAFPIEAGDVLAYARTVESLLQQYRAVPQPLDQKRRRAADFIASRYPPEQEEREILTIRRAMLHAS